MYRVARLEARVPTDLEADKALQAACRLRAQTARFRMLRPDGNPSPLWYMHYGLDWGDARKAAYTHAKDVRRLNFRSLTRDASEKISIGVNAMCRNSNFRQGLLSLEDQVKHEISSNIGSRAGGGVKTDALLCILLAVRHSAIRRAGLIEDDGIAAHMNSMLSVWSKGYGTFFDVMGSPIVYAPQERGCLLGMLRTHGGV